MKKPKTNFTKFSAVFKKDKLMYLLALVFSLMILTLVGLALLNEKTGEEQEETHETFVQIDYYDPIQYESTTNFYLNNKAIQLPGGWEVKDAYVATSIQENKYLCQGECVIYEVANEGFSVYFSSPNAVILNSGPDKTQLLSKITLFGAQTDLVTYNISLINDDVESSAPIQQYTCNQSICIASSQLSLDSQKEVELFTDLLEYYQ